MTEGTSADPGTPPAPTSADRPSTVRDVQYKGEPLDAARGPGLGCFRIQLVALGILVFLTPLSVVWHWPDWASAILLFATLILLLISGQTIIFLLRLVAADRRAARRRPLAASTKTIGELEDQGPPETRRDTNDVGQPGGSGGVRE